MKIEDGYVIFEPTDNVKIEPKIITGHPFVELIGLNKFTLKGDALLHMFKILKNEADPKYLKRGNVAEEIVKIWLEKEGHRCVTYDPKVIKYNNFSESKDFGGLIDIEIPSEQTLVEVKSKSMKSLPFIEQSKPLDEVYQGMLYAYLRGYNTFKMVWIFFDEQTEDEIFRGLKPTTLKNIRKIDVDYEVEKGDIIQKMWQAKQIVDEFVETKKIELKDISEKCFTELKAKYKITNEMKEQKDDTIEEDLFTFNEADFEDMGF